MMKTIRSCLILAGILWAQAAWADCANKLADLVRIEGVVSVKPAGKVLRQTPKKLPMSLCQGDEVMTFQGRALIETISRDAITLDADSTLTLKNQSLLALNRGRVLFDIQKRTGGKAVQVATRLSVIGVKGTRFLLTSQNESLIVTMDEGVVEVISSVGQIKLFREKDRQQQNDFDAFRREGEMAIEAQKKEFESYQAKQEREFVAYVYNVSLAAGSSLEMNRSEATERTANASQKAVIADLQQWPQRR